jgi:hypothetical protein
MSFDRCVCAAVDNTMGDDDLQSIAEYSRALHELDPFGFFPCSTEAQDPTLHSAANLKDRDPFG